MEHYFFRHGVGWPKCLLSNLFPEVIFVGKIKRYYLSPSSIFRVTSDHSFKTLNIPIFTPLTVILLVLFIYFFPIDTSWIFFVVIFWDYVVQKVHHQCEHGLKDWKEKSFWHYKSLDILFSYRKLKEASIRTVQTANDV